MKSCQYATAIGYGGARKKNISFVFLLEKAGAAVVKEFFLWGKKATDENES